MPNRYTEFLVASSSSAPKTLAESIRQVDNLSAGFCRSWLANEITEALTTSEEAFQLFDHIQNAILRHRDEKSKLPGWSTDPFKVALDKSVGNLIDPASPIDKAFFHSLIPGAGAFPLNASHAPLTLATALNKLKHRSTSAANFTVSPYGAHVLYIFTNAGMGKQDTISSFDVHVFCSACKAASAAI